MTLSVTNDSVIVSIYKPFYLVLFQVPLNNEKIVLLNSLKSFRRQELHPTKERIPKQTLVLGIIFWHACFYHNHPTHDSIENKHLMFMEMN